MRRPDSLSLLWLCALGCSSHPGETRDAPASADALPSDASNESQPDAGSAGWETVQTISNDGQVIVEQVSYRSGALLINGRVCRPADTAAHPVIMYNHGGFQGLSIDPELAECPASAKLGYVWMSSSYRGEDGSQGQVEVCLGEVDDVLAMLRIGAAQPYARADRVAMLGGSHGGCITLRALESGAPVRVAADLFGPTDWTPVYDFWRTQAAGGSNASYYNELMSIMSAAAGGTPETAGSAYTERSPITAIADLPAGVPLMVVHGAADTTVPDAQSCQLAAPLGLAAYHDDGSGHDTTAVPAGCETSGVTWLAPPRPTGGWPGSRYLVVYDGLGHETQSPSAQTMLQDVAEFLMAKL